ncbi:MAG: galactokinase [Treponema sp.]|jgi:galactokinase|nr:galactokinase [Treponema sp.]
MTAKVLLEKLDSGKAGTILASLYGYAGVEAARRRYAALVQGVLHWPENPPVSKNAEAPRDTSAGMAPGVAAGDFRFFTAAGRTELGGNHTDHNRGKVLAASIQLDSVAVAAPRRDNTVVFRSSGYPDVVVDISPANLAPRPEEKNTAEALVRGIAAEFAARGVEVGGFTANADSTVLPGSGLSSSAAVEVLFGRIFDSFYGEGKRSALEIAQIGQRAENNYFGKPSGLMDQTACASGGVVSVDFADAAHPLVKGILFDPAESGYALCVVDTHGSHADLTPDYAAIPAEMKSVARFFGKEVLREISREELLLRGSELRQALGDRALLRSLHFFEENRRVDTMEAALKTLETASGNAREGAMKNYLELVNESGHSSWELLQNIYSPQNVREQGIGLALALTRDFLRSSGTKPASQDYTPTRGACRVHGGGFAGTIQAYIPRDLLDPYRILMEGIFGPRAVTELKIRAIGGAELDF